MGYYFGLMKLKPIFDFLSGLSGNNNRDWMEIHKLQYLGARAEFEHIVNHLIMEISAFDPAVQGLSPKDCIFRLNRDIRFSKDKSPYKTHFGAYIASGGRKSESAGYYLHLQPGDNSLLGGGIYMPSGEALKKVRQEVDYNPSELKKIVSDLTFKTYFGSVQGEHLKKAPKGYQPDHPNIEFLKLKSYFVLHNVTDEEALAPGFLKKTVDVFSAMQPFNDFLNVAVS
jgi:uncharacterized protein (TIGR02453 family)